MTDISVETEGLVKRYGDVTALRGVDLAVSRGEVLGLLGPNGAGKTTTVRILTTLLRPDGGRASVAGIDVVARPHAVRAVIGLAGQYATIDEHLTGRENLELVGRLYHLGAVAARRRAGELLERFDLSEAADRLAKTYSGGMRRRLDLAASLVADPAVLFLDEPTTGLDPRSRLALWDVIASLRERGTTIVLTTQYLEEADRLADQIVVIDDGAVIAAGSPDQLKSRVGSEVLEIAVSDRSRTHEAATALTGLTRDEIASDPATGRVRLPVAAGSPGVIDALRRLDDAGLSVVDLSLRRPSLDDVFLALTGRSASSGEPDTLPTPGGSAHRQERSAA